MLGLTLHESQYGSHGFPLKDALDPDAQWTADVYVDYAQEAVDNKRTEYREQYPDAQAGLMFVPRLIEPEPESGDHE